MRYVNSKSALPSVRTVVSRQTPLRLSPCRRWQSTTAAVVGAAKEHYISSDDGFRTLRARQYGNKPLPLPSFMDPPLIEAKERYKRRKPDPKRDLTQLTPFQRELRSNVYALALETSVRQCAVTRLRLPNHFLLKFRLEISATDGTGADSRTAAKETLSLVPLDGLIGSYIVGCKPAIELISRSKKRLGLLWTDPVAGYYESKTGKSRQNIRPAQDLGWDAHMPSVVEHGLRNILLREMDGLLASHLATGTEGSVSQEQAPLVQDVAALIRLGHDVDTADGVDTSTKAKMEETTRRGLLMYDLTKLIPFDELEEWRRNTGSMATHLFVKKSSGAAVLRAAERLLNYLSCSSNDTDGPSSASEAKGRDHQ